MVLNLGNQLEGPGGSQTGFARISLFKARQKPPLKLIYTKLPPLSIYKKWRNRAPALRKKFPGARKEDAPSNFFRTRERSAARPVPLEFW